MAVAGHILWLGPGFLDPSPIIEVWDLPAGTLVQTLEAYDPVTVMKFLEDDRVILTFWQNRIHAVVVPE